MKPKVAHILLGAHELEGAGTGNEPAEVGTIPLGNIGTTVSMLKAANIPAVIGDRPPCPGMIAIDSTFHWNMTLPAFLGRAVRFWVFL
jgi:hypothetical protein